MEDPDPFVEEFHPRRSRRLALIEVNETLGVTNSGTPNKSASPEEMLIVQRGPRRKPVTWSPVEYSRTKLLGPPRERTPEPVIHSRKFDLNPRLRKRLVLSPVKNSSHNLGEAIAKKLMLLKNLERDN